MGNYCCIASKHQQQQQKAKHNKYKYKDDHQQQLNDLYDNKLLPITNNHNKSSLYNSDKTKLKSLYNNNNNLKNDSASILLLSNTSSTVSSVTLSTNTLSEQSTTTTLTNISNTTNHKTRGENHLIPLLKLNQIIIESSSQLDEPIISKELYNINENEDENQEKHSPTATTTISSGQQQQQQQVTPLSNKFILNKTVNSKKLSQRKRTSYLNQSLNETDRDLTKTYQYVGRRLLNDDYDEHNNSSSGEILDIKEEEEHNNPNNNNNNETKTTEALNLFNWKNYKSLQKSKRSIKNLEETIQNSRSIEQWLNDFSKLKLFDGLRKKQQQHQQDGLKQQSLNAINKIDEETITSRSITNKRRLSNCVSITLDDDHDENGEKESKISQLLPSTPASNNNLTTNDLDEFDLILNKERCNNEINLNQFLNEIEKRKQPQSSTRLFSAVNKQLLKLLNEQQHEQEMSFKLTNLLLPKSLANSEDIDMLKWLLTNNQLRLVSFNNELTFTNDHLVLTQQNNMNFLLIANKLNIDLEENDCNNESIMTDDDNDDDMLVESLVDKLDKLNESYSAYVKYDALTGCLKLNKNLIEKLLNKEKDLILKLSQTTNAACLLVSSSTSSTTTADLSSSSINPTTDSTNSTTTTTNTPTIIDKYRKYILDTCNFKGAQILMNIKKKQILNRKCSSTQFNNNNNNQMNVNNNNNNNKLKSELNKKKIKNNAKNNNKQQQQVQYLSPTPLGNFIFFKFS